MRIYFDGDWLLKNVPTTIKIDNEVFDFYELKGSDKHYSYEYFLRFVLTKAYLSGINAKNNNRTISQNFLDDYIVLGK